MTASMSTSPRHLDVGPSDVRHLEGVGHLTLTYESILWLGVGAIALFARVWALGHTPLNDAEAAVALQALALARGEAVTVANPFFSALQAIVVSLFGATDLSARLIPALAGAALCVLPAWLRREIGPIRALAFGLLLALSPTLWFVSRQSDGAVLAWALAFGVWCAWVRGANTTGWLLGGLLLACGADAVTPALTVFATLAAGNHLSRLRATSKGLLIVTGACLAAATAFGLRLSGLGDMFNGYALWFAQFTQPGPLTLLRGTAGFIVNEPLLWLGAVTGTIALASRRRASREVPAGLAGRIVPWLAWAGMGFGMYALTQSRGVDGFVPVLIGCAALASATAETALHGLADRRQWAAIGAVAGVALVMVVYGYMGFLLYAGQGESMWLLTAVIALVMVGGITIVATLTLGSQVALTGVGLAAGICLAVYTLGTGIQLTQTRADNPAEPYIVHATLDGVNELRKALAEVSSRAYGEPAALSIELADSAPPSLRWAVRDWPKASFAPQPGAGEALLTPANATITTASAYIGSDFAIDATAPVGAARCDDRSGQFSCFPLARWLALRTLDGSSDISSRTTRWVLWLRQDLALRYSGK